jgi:hypothetical protein
MFKEMVKNSKELKGPVKTYYSDGYEIKSMYISDDLDGMMNFYKNILNTNIDIQVMYLAEKDHLSIAPIPYGMPFIFGSMASWHVNMPAEAGIFDTLLSDILSSDLKKNIRDYVDLVGFHEIGHAFSYQVGLGELNHHQSEFFATYMSYAYLRENRPEKADMWLDYNRASLLLDQELNYRSLDVFNKNYMLLTSQEPKNYLWYQAMFSLGVEKVYEEKGVDFLLESVKMLKDLHYEEEAYSNVLCQISKAYEEWYLGMTE